LDRDHVITMNLVTKLASLQKKTSTRKNVTNHRNAQIKYKEGGPP